ncbi:MAG: CapA family protein [Clostridia bacterium]
MIFHKRFLVFILLFCLFSYRYAIADENTEKVTVVILDAEGNPITNEKEVENNDSVLLTMSFAGDVTIGTNVQHKGASIFEKELERHGSNIHFAFSNVKDIFQSDDLTMVNFEGTLTSASRNPSKLNNAFLFRADPSYVDLFSRNGIETVSLENNHVLDMGEDGNIETKRTLLNAGITYASENEPAIMTVKGIKIGSLAYQTFGGRHDELIDKVPNDIENLRDAGCQIIIVSYHWGNEKDTTPNENQIRLGRATIDAGADLVVGHHSHRINPIEYYHDRYICYSLGNFCFAGNSKPDDMSTYIFQIRIQVINNVATSEHIRIVPCRISSNTDYNDFTPTPYEKASDVEALIKKLVRNSRGLEYAIDEYPLIWGD